MFFSGLGRSLREFLVFFPCFSGKIGEISKTVRSEREVGPF